MAGRTQFGQPFSYTDEMRNRISTMLIDGKIMPIIKHRTFFGECCTAVFAATESPEHARSNIRKVLAHKKRMIRNQVSGATCRADRHETYLAFGKTGYRIFYGLN